MKEIYVYCNAANLTLVHPIEISKPLMNDYEVEFVALYNLDELNKLTEDEYRTAGAWWREIGSLNISIDQEYQPRVMRRTGLLTYICDTWGISTERHVACAIGSISGLEGKTPIEFFNSLKII